MGLLRDAQPGVIRVASGDVHVAEEAAVRYVCATAALAKVERSAGIEEEAKRLFNEALRVVKHTDYRVLTVRLRGELREGDHADR